MTMYVVMLSVKEIEEHARRLWENDYITMRYKYKNDLGGFGNCPVMAQKCMVAWKDTPRRGPGRVRTGPSQTRSGPAPDPDAECPSRPPYISAPSPDSFQNRLSRFYTWIS